MVPSGRERRENAPVSKTKGRRGKSATKGRRRDPRPGAAAETPTAQAPAARPAGQRLFDMPYSSQVPSPVRPDLGLTSLVARAGHNAGYDIDLTLLDAADHRLIRTGLVLAHRVLDGRGEWYLGAPDWVPLLPKELIVPMGQGRAARRPGRAGPTVPSGRSPGAGGGAALRTAGVRSPGRRGPDRRPAARRQGDGPSQRPDDRALPRGDADPGGSRAGPGAGRVAGPVPGGCGWHRGRALPPVDPPPRGAGHRAVGPAGPRQACRTAPSASSSPSCWEPVSVT